MAAERRAGPARAGTAGVEFALLTPVLLVLLLGTIDLSGALLTARRMTLAARAVTEIATTGAAQSRTLDELTDTQAWQATTAAFAYFPAWADGSAGKTFAVTVSAIAFTVSPQGCTRDCTYTGAVIWSVANDLGAAALRACGPVPLAANSAPSSYATVAAGNEGPTLLIAADVSYTFQPAFLGFVIGAIPMMQTAYLSPRINNDIRLVSAGGGGVTMICPATS